MKKTLFFGAVILASLVPLACQKNYYLGPLSTTPTFTPTPTGTPTATSTPVCYFGAPGLVGAALPSGANPSAVPQTNPAGGAPFTIIRTQADWDALYGTSSPPAAPVDFSTDMLIIVSNALCCPSLITSIAGVCEGAGQVNITVSERVPAVECYEVCFGSTYSAVAVPTSNLPVTWTVADFLPGLGTTPIVFPLITPTPSPTP